VLFQATNKTKYAFLSVYVRFVTKCAHPLIQDVVNNCLVSLHGDSNHHIGPDTVTEKINLETRSVKFFYKQVVTY
jgi:hypothetical protein